MGETDRSDQAIEAPSISLIKEKWVPATSDKRGKLIRYANELIQRKHRDWFYRLTADAIFFIKGEDRDAQQIYIELKKLHDEVGVYLKPVDEREGSFDEKYLRELLDELVRDFEYARQARVRAISFSV